MKLTRLYRLFIMAFLLTLVSPANALDMNDPHFPDQWALNGTNAYGIDAQQAWDITTGGGIIIAVLDNGVDIYHEDLTGQIYESYDCVDDLNDCSGGDNDPTPDAGDNHGTMVAGIIAANGNNGLGTAGVCPDCYLMPIRTTLGNPGEINTDLGLIAGIRLATARGARVINISAGLDASVVNNPDPEVQAFLAEFQDAIADAVAAGVVVVAAVGNDGAPPVKYPALLPDVIAVSASNHCGQIQKAWDINCLHSFNIDWGSSYGTGVDIAAPGVGIYTTTPGNQYYSFGGTSAAAPIISGVVGLMLSVDPTLKPAEIRQMLIRTATDTNSATYPGFDALLGGGLVNANRAVAAAYGTYVDDFEPSTLVSAINQANANGAMTIRLNQMTILNSVHNTGGNGANGLPVITGFVRIVSDKGIIQRDATAPPFRFFEVASGGFLSLRKLALVGGNTAGSGGAIFNGGSLGLDNVTLRGNQAGSSGGAIFNLNQTTLINSRVDSNSAAGSGGGIASDAGNLSIMHSELTGNTSGSNGGAVFNGSSELHISTSSIQKNTAINGSAVFNSNGAAEVRESCVIGNNDAAVVNFYSSALDATQNWWGSSTGPSGAGMGMGDGVSANVNYGGYHTQLLDTPVHRVTGGCRGPQANSTSYNPTFSADGRYLMFTSAADNLVPNDMLRWMIGWTTSWLAYRVHEDAFYFDLQTGAFSSATAAYTGYGNIGSPAISADRRYLVFNADLRDLVPMVESDDPDDPWDDVYLVDTFTNTIKVITAGRGSGAASISADGRYVAFSSLDMLTVTDDNQCGAGSCTDIYVYDRDTQQFEMISVTDQGTAFDYPSQDANISPDGRYVAFLSGDGTGTTFLNIRDRHFHTTRHLGRAIPWNGYKPVWSGDSRYLVYLRQQEVGGQTLEDLVRYDMQTQEATPVVIAPDGSGANGYAMNGVISANGRFVAFLSDATNLVNGDAVCNHSLCWSVFVRDMNTNQIVRVSKALDGGWPNGGMGNLALSPDGQYVAFTSDADNLAPNDSLSINDIFLASVVFPPLDPLNAAPVRNRFTTTTPTLTWNEVTWATGYDVQVANNPNFFDAVQYPAGNNLSLTLPDAVQAGVVYSWRVRAVNNGQPGTWSNADRFIVP